MTSKTQVEYRHGRVARAGVGLLAWLLALAPEALSASDITEYGQCIQLLESSQPKGQGYCQTLLDDETNSLSKNQISRIRIDMASNVIVRGQFQRAQELLGTALALNENLLDNNMYRFNWLRMKSLLEFRQDNFGKAIGYMKNALAVAKEIDQSQAIAKSYNDLGATYRELGEMSRALENLNKALQFQEIIGNNYSIALTQANIASIYADRGDYERAIDYQLRALISQKTYLDKNPDDFYALRAEAQVHEDLGVSYMATGQTALAHQSLEFALDRYVLEHLALDQIRVLAAMADLELDNMKPAIAMQLLERALKLEARVKPKRSIEVRRGLVSVYSKTQNFNAAIEAATEGLQLASEKQQFRSELFFLKQKAFLQRDISQPQQALKTFETYLQRYETYLEGQNRVEIADLKAVIEVHEQQKEIESLERDALDLQLTVKKQRWLALVVALIVAIIIAALSLVFVLIFRQREYRKLWLNREISLHRQGLESQAGEGDTSYQENQGTPMAEGNTLFHQKLVQLMRSCIEIWEQVSGSNKIELAERSRIWQVAIDNGRLRTRTMDRYTDIKRLPKVPRWRQVVRTCRYILINCELSDPQRTRLNEELEELFEIQRQRALQSS